MAVQLTSNEAGHEANTRSLAALDAGPHGLFTTEAVALDDGSPGVRLQPTETDAAVDALVSLFDPQHAPTPALGQPR